jgi:hypothetical protein
MSVKICLYKSCIGMTNDYLMSEDRDYKKRLYEVMHEILYNRVYD